MYVWDGEMKSDAGCDDNLPTGKGWRVFAKSEVCKGRRHMRCSFRASAKSQQSASCELLSWTESSLLPWRCLSFLGVELAKKIHHFPPTWP